MLEVRLLGTFAIRHDGKPVVLSSRAAQSLFAYLILNPGTQFRREKLAGMLWPEAGEERARAYLRHELWRIRKALSTGSRVEYLIADDIYIAFQASSEYWLDAGLLLGLREDSSTEDLLDVLSVCHGELLPGFYEDSIVHEREHLQAIYEKNIARLLDLLEKEKRWDEILDWAERWISVGQGPEAAYRSLMVAYDALGDRAKVASTYQRCVQALRQLDLEPSEQTRALAFKRRSKLNIPIPITSFVGRERELKEVAELFSKSRLITLTGSGGVGKTRLAIQVVAEVLDMFPDGICFLDLAPLTDPTFVPNTLAALLGLRVSGELPITDILVNYFRSRTALVIFDNCEHLIQECAQLVNSLLTSCEQLSILATSREVLRVSGEIPYRVPSLEIPTTKIDFTINEVSNIESVNLFMQRVSAISPTFEINKQNAPAIVQICKRLDGIPLAIELAAARVSVLSVQQILQRLDDRFNLLTHGLRSSLPRQQTLGAMIEWSYGLLSEKEKLLFSKLTVFVGGWTLEAAEEVCSGNSIEPSEVLDLLSLLVNKSLILVETNDGIPRYRMLETIRQFAREKLEQAGEQNQVHDRHLAYYREFAAQAKPHIISSEQFLWLNSLQTELDNIRAALLWAQHSSTADAGLGLVTDLFMFWLYRAYFGEACLAIRNLLKKPVADNQIQLLGKAHYVAGWLEFLLGNHAVSLSHANESERLCLQLGAAGKADLAATRNLYNDIVLYHLYDPTRARHGFDANLELLQEVGDQWGTAHAMGSIGTALRRSGDLIGARQATEKAQALVRECGDSIRVTQAEVELAVIALDEDKYAEARRRCEEAISFYRRAPVNFSVDAPLYMMGAIALREKDYGHAQAWYTECLLFDQQIGVLDALAECLIGFAGIAHAEKRLERAAKLVGVAARELDRGFLELFDQVELQRLTKMLREELGWESFEELASQGRMMGREQAVAYALEKREEDDWIS